MARKKSRPKLTRARILDAAVAIADREGVDGLSMRKIGRSLGVEAMSLYNHVSNRDDILDGLADVFVSELAECVVARPSSDWRSSLEAYASAMRTALKAHPWASQVLESRSGTSEIRMRHHDAVIGIYRRAGFSIALAQRAYLAVDSYVYGFALQEASWAVDEADVPDAIASIATPTGQFPYLNEMMSFAAKAASKNPDAPVLYAFDFGLDLILDGLERLREQSAGDHNTASEAEE